MSRWFLLVMSVFKAFGSLPHRIHTHGWSSPCRCLTHALAKGCQCVTCSPALPPAIVSATFASSTPCSAQWVRSDDRRVRPRSVLNSLYIFLSVDGSGTVLSGTENANPIACPSLGNGSRPKMTTLTSWGGINSKARKIKCGNGLSSSACGATAIRALVAAAVTAGVAQGVGNWVSGGICTVKNRCKRANELALESPCY